MKVQLATARVEQEIETHNFYSFDRFIEFVAEFLNIEETSVYAIGTEGDVGVIFCEHKTTNIIDYLYNYFNPDVRLLDKEFRVFVFEYPNYNDAVSFILDMKETSGLLKWQLEENNGIATVKGGEIKITSNAN